MRQPPARHLVYAAAAFRLSPPDVYDPPAPVQFNFVYRASVAVAEGATVRRRNLEQDPHADGQRRRRRADWIRVRVRGLGSGLGLGG